LFSWFAACLGVAAFDQLILTQPLKSFNDTFRLENSGNYAEALEVLNELDSPFIKCPSEIVERRKVNLLISSSELEAAQSALNSSKSAIKKVDRKSLEAKLIAHSSIEQAIDSLDEATSALLKLERAFLVRKSGAKPWMVKNAFEEVLELPIQTHSSGESTHVLANAWLQATRLWTGHAEEAIRELGSWISRLQRASIHLPGLRGQLAALYAERAYYYATHREPFLASNDLSVARALTKQTSLQERFNEIDSELKLRHGIEGPEGDGNLRVSNQEGKPVSMRPRI